MLKKSPRQLLSLLVKMLPSLLDIYYELMEAEELWLPARLFSLRAIFPNFAEHFCILWQNYEYLQLCKVISPSITAFRNSIVTLSKKLDILWSANKIYGKLRFNTYQDFLVWNGSIVSDWRLLILYLLMKPGAKKYLAHKIASIHCINLTLGNKSFL